MDEEFEMEAVEETKEPVPILVTVQPARTKKKTD